MPPPPEGVEKLGSGPSFSQEEDTRRLLFGTDEALQPQLLLQAGPLSMRLVGTRLLSIHAGPHEVWHGVAFLYRDADWGTPEPVVEQIEQEPLAGGFRVSVRAHVPWCR